MPTQRKKLKDINIARLEAIDKAADSFNSNASETQKPAFNKLKRAILTKLDLNDDGTIKITAKNLQQVQRFRTIRNEIISPAYEKDVQKFINKFDQVKKTTDTYFTKLPDNA